MDAVRTGLDFERCFVRLTARKKIPVQHTPGHVTAGEMIDRSTYVTARVSQLKTSRKNQIQRSPGDHTKLPRLSNGAGETPAGYSGTHSALNDRWQ